MSLVSPIYRLRGQLVLLVWTYFTNYNCFAGLWVYIDGIGFCFPSSNFSFCFTDVYCCGVSHNRRTCRPDMITMLNHCFFFPPWILTQLPSIMTVILGPYGFCSHLSMKSLTNSVCRRRLGDDDGNGDAASYPTDGSSTQPQGIHSPNTVCTYGVLRTRIDR